MSRITKEGVEVRVGQVWRDLDKRMDGRQVMVTALGDAHAWVGRFANGAVVNGKATRLAVRRMHKGATGWALVSDIA